VATLPRLEPETRLLLRRFEIFSVVVFTLEYFSRILVADSQRAYIFLFFGICDVLAVAPFYLATGVDLRSLRSFRLLRLVRILKMAI